MRYACVGSSALLFLLLASQAGAQGVQIPHGAAPAVVEVLKTDLLPQGFQLQRADQKTALFTLDRGMVGQRQGGAIHVVLELQFSFKQKSDGLVVRADEVVVGQAGTSFENRKPVESRVERDNLQRLLDSVRARIEATADSAGRHDSTSRR